MGQPFLSPSYDVKAHQRSIRIFYLILAVAAISTGFASSVLSNYFKDVYQITAIERGLIEFPREFPGVITVFLVSMLISLGDLRIAIVAQTLVVIGLVFLGFLTPPFAVMLVFVFIHSVGDHIWMPMSNSISLGLIREEASAGRLIGQFNGVSTAFGMLASLLVFLGFRFGFFSFLTPIKGVFVIAAFASLIVMILLGYLHRHNQNVLNNERARAGQARANDLFTGLQWPKFVIRREYRYYYLLAIIFGVQKQIMIVYGPWVLIDLLGKKADTLSLLLMIGSFVGIFFTPLIGRWLDQYGIRTMLFWDAYSFIGVYVVYGLLTAGFTTGAIPLTGLAVFATYGLFILDRMSMQMGMVRNMYLRSIIVQSEDISPTLTLGQSLDHIVSITMAIIGGFIWTNVGPQYVFFIAAALSLGNWFVALKVKRQHA
ncbi:MAG: MFS transporter [Eubacteriales bacterium]|nr:MFS transporter [Eubacteriales bacterium]